MTWSQVLVSGLAVVLGACSSSGATAPVTPIEPTTSTDRSVDLFPDVVDVTVFASEEGSYDFDVTLSSPYDTPARYADAWRVKGEDGTVYAVRELTHDHAGEQPFTRSLRSVEIPVEIDAVIVEGRDQLSGWGGATMEVDLP